MVSFEDLKNEAAEHNDGNAMNRKLVLLVLILCLIATVLLSQTMCSQSFNNKQEVIQTDKVHNIDTGLNYTSIQTAIDANETLDGHTIFVDEGTYHEHVVVGKSLKLIGENKDTAIIDGDNFGNVVNLFQEENVSISGFTVRNSGSTPYDTGILISYSSNITVYHNIITGNNYGIRLISSSNNNVSSNSIRDNNYRGVDLTTSSHNIISKNNITDNHCGAIFSLSHNNTLFGNIVSNNVDGISLGRSDNNTLLDNIVSNNTGIGIDLLFATHNILRSNIMTNNTYANFGVGFSELVHCFNDVAVSNLVDDRPVYYWIDKHNDEVPLDAGYVALVNCSNITVDNLTLENNIQGILLANTDSSLITHNNIMNTDKGITLTFSHGNIVSGNTMTDNMFYGIVCLDNSYNNTVTANDLANSWGGILLDHSSNNTIFHNNFVDNSEQTYRSASANVWDNSVEGNYWSSYNVTDSDHDGIGDMQYEIDQNNIDRYPLMGMFSSFNTSLGYHVNVISNPPIEDSEFFESNSTITMYISNMTSNQAYGFCRTCIPKSLIAPKYCVTINDGSVEVLYFNDTIYDNGTHRWICFSYEHSLLKIVIVPEFPLFIILPLFMTSTLLAVLIYNTQKKDYANKAKIMI